MRTILAVLALLSPWPRCSCRFSSAACPEGFRAGKRGLVVAEVPPQILGVVGRERGDQDHERLDLVAAGLASGLAHE